MPRFTIITVVRNDLAGLQRTRESIASQEATDFSHLVIDGASTDGTREWLESQPPAENFRWVSERDAGVYDAMNKGASMVDSGFIVFMNAGDTYIGRAALANQQRAADRSRARWGYSRAIVVNEDQRPVRPPFGLRRYSTFKHAYARVALCHQAVFVRKSVFDEIGGFEPNLYQEVADYAFLLDLGRRHKPVVLDTVDVAYLDGGISAINPHTQLLKHRARAGVFAMRAHQRALDYAFFLYSEGTARARRLIKRSVRRLGGDFLITRYASRGAWPS